MKFVSPGSGPSGTSDLLDLDQLLADMHWASLVDLLPEGVVLVDRTGFVRYMNPAAESSVDIPRLEVVNRSLHHFVKQSAIACDVILEAFMTASRISHIVSSRSQQNYLLNTRCSKEANGELSCFIVTLRGTDQLSRLIAQAPGGSHSQPVEFNVGELAPMVISDQTRPIMALGLRAMAQGSRILLLGESGVGKTELARHLQHRTGGATRAFVHVNCGSIPESLFESEMFGYERGSFTGALAKGKKGLVESADGGVLFLDEIGEIPLSSQAKMLQFLEDGAISRVGSTQAKKLSLQVVAATNRNLTQLVAAGRFRRDLYYRLSVVTLTLPPLRSSPELVPQLIERFSAALSRKSAVLHWTDGAIRRLCAYTFPGNVRELRNIVEHLSAVCETTVSQKDVERTLLHRAMDETNSMAENRDSDVELSISLRESVRNFESRVIREAIARCGSKRKAAEQLGVDIATIVRKSRQS